MQHQLHTTRAILGSERGPRGIEHSTRILDNKKKQHILQEISHPRRSGLRFFQYTAGVTAGVTVSSQVPTDQAIDSFGLVGATGWVTWAVAICFAFSFCKSSVFLLSACDTPQIVQLATTPPKEKLVRFPTTLKKLCQTRCAKAKTQLPPVTTRYR